MSYPDFLCIGAQKAGTTWLHRNLQTHPDIWMPKEKELHYFDEKIRQRSTFVSRLRGNHPEEVRWRRQARSRLKKFRKGMTLDELRWDLRYFFGKPGDGWYASLFDPGEGKITGEITPDYSILDVKTVSHVRELMPEGKIIFFMRNPIERPWSVADMASRFKKGARLDGAVSEDLFRQQFKKKRVRMLGNYLRTLDNWSRVFPEDQIFIGFLEDVHFFPAGLMRGVYEFLGADTSREYRVIDKKIHSGSTSRMPISVATFLARRYHESMEELHERFGGYASFWLYCAERLISDPPASEDGQIPYPLWESSLWEEWARGENTPRLGSGTLSSIGAVAS